MPYSIVHLDIAKRKSEDLWLKNDDLIDFLVWNLIVDFSYVLSDLWVNFTREETHYHPKENYFLSDFPNNFFKKEIKSKEDYLKIWYYYHLLLDKFRRDNELKNIYQEDDMRNAYQISRKINAKYDLENFLEQEENKQIIDKLYSYLFDSKKLPSVFSKIDTKILKEAFSNFLLYMTWENEFEKWKRNENTDDLIKKYFSYKNHIKLKNEAYEKIKEI